MPKLKTNKAAKKRFKITGRRKVMKSKTSRRHLLTDKKSGHKRKLRRWQEASQVQSRMIRTLLPYG
ncbi:MAG: 50S ribosomal protein L35 [Candidatus Omnitrophica bacterium]|nr:50S ribosomal protein L35 [Candidatus Omnitrophota bacterium]